MSNSQTAPELCPMSQCNGCLDFQPLGVWPQNLPAVAVNGLVLAGFSQDLVFNHRIDKNSSEAVADLFRELHSELSFSEMARLLGKIQSSQDKSLDWFPISLINSKFHWIYNEQLLQIAEALLKTPFEFQKWCSEKKLSPHDLSCLLTARGLDLNYFFDALLPMNLSKALGAEALQLSIELIWMGHRPETLTAGFLLSFNSDHQNLGEAWVEALNLLRHPRAYQPATFFQH